MNKHNLRTPEGRLASLMEHFERDRKKAQEAGLWDEVRYWVEIPDGQANTPSHWAPIAYCTHRNAACILASALQAARGWKVEVWTCSPVSDPDIPPTNPNPIEWHISDRYH